MRHTISLSNYRCFPQSEPAKYSFSTGAITAFVGPNNAGKSMPLRFLWEFRSLFAAIGQPGNLADALSGRHQASGLRGLGDPDEAFHNNNKLGIEFDFEVSGAAASSSRGPVPRGIRVSVTRPSANWTAELYGPSSDFKVSEGQRIKLTDGPSLMQGGTAFADVRTLSEAALELSNSLYLGSSRNAISVSGDEPYFDLQVGKAFVTKWREFKSGPNKFANEAAIELQDEVARIFGFRSLEINPSSDGSTLKVNVNRKSHSLSELGAGVGQVIICLAFAATQNASFILIDEPELSLHPSLQLEFLTALQRYAGSSVLLSTHSIGLARSVAQHVYSVQRTGEFSRMRPWDSAPTLPEFMGEMSFSAHRELGFDRVLLVEGRTDAEPIRVWLRALHLDRRVLVMSLGGSSLINDRSAAELREVTRIAADASVRVFALIDSERSTQSESVAADRKLFLRNCKLAGIECTVLARRALENYFPSSAIQAAMRSEKYRALEPFEKLETSAAPWGKNLNVRIAEHMAMSDLAGTDLGTFLQSLA